MVYGVESNLRNAEIECLVVDKSGIIYRGEVKSNLVDYQFDVRQEDILSNKLKEKIISPVRSENWAEWKN